MISSFTLGNFKAFGPAQKVPLKPITLIFGPNSAGKSSIIHSLLFAHQAFWSGDLDVHETTLGGKSVDLGGFEQLTYQTDAENAVRLAFHFPKISTVLHQAWNLDEVSINAFMQIVIPPVERRPGESEADWIIRQSGDFYDRLSVKVDDPDKLLEAFIVEAKEGRAGFPVLRRFEVEVAGAPLVTASRRPDGDLRIDTFALDHPSCRAFLESLVSASVMKQSFDEQDQAIVARAINEILPSITLDPRGFSVQARRERTQSLALSRNVVGTGPEDLPEVARLVFPRLLFGLFDGINASLRSFLNGLEYLGPLRSYPPRHQLGIVGSDESGKSEGAHAWRAVLENTDLRAKVNSWLSSDFLQTKYELGVNSLVPLHLAAGALESEFEDIVQEAAILHDEDRQAAGDSEATERFYNPYDQLDVPKLYKRMLGRIVSRSLRSAVPELTLRDKRTGTFVSHRDIGIGISQLLPVLVNAYGSKGRTIAIEQPEIHLHPALQAELADVFLESALGAQKNTFLLETHSEHLMLRVIRHIRETRLGHQPSGAPPVRPDDVSVLFVLPTEQGAEARQLRLDDQGRFIDPWPGGFFEESFNELF